VGVIEPWCHIPHTQWWPILPSYTLQGLTLKRHIEATLGSGNIREAVRLPVGEDLCEWLAVNTVDFYNAISVLFGTLEEFCTVHSCSLMTAGPKASRAAALIACCTLNV
jgi:Mob1/phocein family